MNSSLQKALVASMLVVGGAVSAIGQGYDYDPNCQDPNNTAPYSAGYISYYLETPLWSAGLGINGTSAWKFCVPGGPSGSVPVSGRFEFGPGTQGSIQDNLRVAAGEYDVSPDDLEDFQYGADHGHDPADTFQDSQEPGSTSGSGWSFARIQINSGTATSSFLFGGNAFTVAYVGQSNRYFTATQVSGTTQVNLQVDVIGDASRFAWSITNEGTANVSYGLELGQWVVPVGGYLQNPQTTFTTGVYGPVDNYGQTLGYLDGQGNKAELQPYIDVPGFKPRDVDQAFIRSTDPTNFPAFVNFTGGEFVDNSFGELTFPITQKISPQLSGGMQIVNSPYQNVQDETGFSDQTPVDEFDIGDVAFLLSGNGIVTSPTFGNVLFSDAAFGDGASFAQKWYYTPTPAGSTDTIIGYYRSIWGDSNYFNGYTGVVDTPKVLAADLSTTSYNLNPNPFHIIVNVDNTGVFGENYKQAKFGSTEVDLILPPGMYPAGGSPTQTTMKQFIPTIEPVSIGTTDFLVAATPGKVGPQPYTVVIKPPAPILSKTIKGVINIAATPRVQLFQGANLIGEPWNFAQNSSWDSVLQTPAVTGFEAYNWDPLAQQYTISTGPQRGIGTWIVAQSPTAGFVPLGGSPQLPTDEFPPSTGAPTILLQPGWNLVGNPYNYSFPLGELVGVFSNSTEDYATMVSTGVLDGSFAYYDPDLQSYDFFGASTDELLPNNGYWLYSTQQLQLEFPPVNDLFVRAPAAPAFKNYVNHWKLQLSATGNGIKDSNNYVGVDTVPNEAAHMIFRKPPISGGLDPKVSAVRAFLTPSSTNYNGNTLVSIGAGVNPIKGQKAGTAVPEYTQMMYNTPGKQVFNFSVFPVFSGRTISGPLTVSWPNLSTIPKNLDVQIKDLTTGQVVNARNASGINIKSADTLTTRTFQVTITPEGTVRQSVSDVTTQVLNAGITKKMNIGFTTSSEGLASLFIYQNGKVIATIATNQQIVAGKNSTVWGMTLKTGQSIKPGTYTLAITAIGDGGDTTTKFTTITL